MTNSTSTHGNWDRHHFDAGIFHRPEGRPSFFPPVDPIAGSQGAGVETKTIGVDPARKMWWNIKPTTHPHRNEPRWANRPISWMATQVKEVSKNRKPDRSFQASIALKPSTRNPHRNRLRIQPKANSERPNSNRWKQSPLPSAFRHSGPRRTSK